MCEFCSKTPNKIWDASQQLLVAHASTADGNGHLLIMVQGNTNPQSVNMRVRYCPWCGEEFK